MIAKFTCLNDACVFLRVKGERNSEWNLSSYARKKCRVCGKMMKKVCKE